MNRTQSWTLSYLSPATYTCPSDLPPLLWCSPAVQSDSIYICVRLIFPLSIYMCPSDLPPLF